MSWRKWTLIGVGGLTLLVLAAWWRSSVAWSQMLSRVQEQQDAFVAEDRARPVLWGEATKGEAAEMYADALAAYEELWAKLSADARNLIEDPDPDREAPMQQFAQNFVSAATGEIVGGAAALLRALREGAHRPIGRRRMDWAGGFDGTTPDVFALINMPVVVGICARDAIENGRGLEGVRILLDGMQFGRDHAHEPQFLMSTVGTTIVAQLCDLLFFRGDDPVRTGLLPKLSRAELELLAAGLVRLDRGWPGLRQSVAGEIVMLVRQVERPNGLDDLAGPGLVLPWWWRLGLSSKLLVADAAEVLFESAAELPRESIPWPRLTPILDAQIQKFQDADNPLLRILTPNWKAIASGRRSGIAQLRMLRLAIAQELGRDEQLEDPFGGHIRYAERDGKRVYWSVGKDGKDDGGDPKKDIVLRRAR